MRFTSDSLTPNPKLQELAPYSFTILCHRRASNHHPPATWLLFSCSSPPLLTRFNSAQLVSPDLISYRANRLNLHWLYMATMSRAVTTNNHLPGSFYPISQKQPAATEHHHLLNIGFSITKKKYIVDRSVGAWPREMSVASIAPSSSSSYSLESVKRNSINCTENLNYAS